MTDKTPEDFNALDGVDDGMVDKCANCDESFHPNNHNGTVYDADGTEYDHIMETDSADRPFFCSQCYKVLDAVRKAKQHKTLSEYNE